MVNIPPWIILGAVLILVPLFVFMTLETLDRQRENTVTLLLEKGAALIRSFEAGARTGMMGMRWGGTQIQNLLEETSKQPDIVHILVSDSKGTILAHNDISRVGAGYGAGLDLKGLSKARDVGWRKISKDQGGDIFEVFRQFAPVKGGFRRHAGRMRTNDWCRAHFNAETASGESGQVIFVGLDMGAVEKARKEDARHIVIMAFILLLIGFAGIVSLFLANAYRSTSSTLSRIRAFSHALVENMPIGLVALDGDGKIASFNQTAETILQLCSREILQGDPKESLPKPLWEIADRLKEEKDPIDTEIECPVSGEKIIPLEVVAASLEEEPGAFSGAVIIFRDLSQVRRLKEEIARTQRLALIGQLAAGVAHEIRNPLSSIKGFATYFKEKYQDIPEERQTAEIMVQEVDRLNRVVGQLLEFARPMAIRKKSASLQEVIRHSLKTVRHEASKKNIDIEENLAPEINAVLIDQDRISQVLLNLYLNAIDSMDNGGTLSIGLSRDQDSGRLMISVSDTGEGISPEDQLHIFDPYFTTKQSGTGLGLAIVNKIIESHGGEIQVKSRSGKGTTILILMPYPGGAGD